VSVLLEPCRTEPSQPELPRTFSSIRCRMTEAGKRTNEVTSEAARIVFGLQGAFGLHGAIG